MAMAQSYAMSLEIAQSREAQMKAKSCCKPIALARTILLAGLQHLPCNMILMPTNAPREARTPDLEVNGLTL